MESFLMSWVLRSTLILLILDLASGALTEVGDNLGCKQWTRYSRLELLDLRDSPNIITDRVASAVEWVANEIQNDPEPQKPPSSQKRRRGRRAGVKERAKRRGLRPPLPTIIYGNVQSIRNKTDELAANCKYNREYKDISLICLTETWLEMKDPDSTVYIDGFNLIRGDRQGTRKQHGGGVGIYINERWCKNVTLKQQYCDDNVEYITISCRPFYLPREFCNVYVTVAYVPPSGDFTQASEILSNCVTFMDENCPKGVNLLLGDFNGCDIQDNIPNYKQYVKCSTRGDKTLDLLFCNIKNGYRVLKRPPLGNSDHNILYCVPSYTQLLKSERPKTITIRQWSEQCIDSLKACFDCTCWDTLFDNSIDINTNVDVCSSYISFCTDMLVPTKSVTVFPNNKPWVTKEVKEVINMKKRSLSCNKANIKDIQKELNTRISQAKTAYKNKVEGLFKSSNSKDAWRGLKVLSGCTKKNCMPEPDNVQDYVDGLNQFYARFDDTQSHDECLDILNVINESNNCERLVLSEKDVLLGLNRAKPGKACGPDRVSSNVVKSCRWELVTPMLRLFQLSLDLCIVPDTWKSSEIVPLPKVNIPKEMNDLRPVALTSVLMKCLESIVKHRLEYYVKDKCDKFQFAYRSGRCVDDAVVTLIESICSHLDKAKCFSRVLFIDFSSAFNTIKPHVLLKKLYNMNVNTTILKWIHSYLTSRTQYVRWGDVRSNTIVTNTGAPQGCVLSPVLFTLYTNDCVSANDQCTIIKYADDTVLIGNIVNNDTNGYRESVRNFVDWCDRNFLNLNVKKTMEIIVDFRRDKCVHVPLCIKEEQVNIVNKYKYLGVYIDDQLSFGENIHRVYCKCLQRLRYLRELANLKVDHTILSLFFKSIIESVMSFCIVSWYGSSTKKDQNKLCKILRAAGKLGIATRNLHEIYKPQCYKLACKIKKDSKHPLHCKYVVLKSGKRLRSAKQRTGRYGNTFVPSSIRLFNHVTKQLS